MALAQHDLDDPLDHLFRSSPTPASDRKPLPASYQPMDFTEPCRKCGGTGTWRGRGACFACKGKGKLTFKTSSAERARNKTLAAEREKRKEATALESFKTEHPAVWAWMDGSTFPFAVSLRDAVSKWGSLTDNQLAASHRAIEKLAAAKVAATERVETAKTIDMSKIEAAFARASASLKRPRLRVAGFTIYPAPTSSKNFGSLYVRGLSADKSEQIYLGRITAAKFIRSRDCSPEQETKLIEIAADPQGAAISYGRLTGSCACCGRMLVDPESVARGIGPICAEKYGWGA